jgi:hypothetical protein
VSDFAASLAAALTLSQSPHAASEVPTPFRCPFAAQAAMEAGFKSLALTHKPALARGTAKGPTPQVRSRTLFLGQSANDTDLNADAPDAGRWFMLGAESSRGRFMAADDMDDDDDDDDDATADAAAASATEDAVDVSAWLFALDALATISSASLRCSVESREFQYTAR